MNRTLALIVARGGSKSLPRKNVLALAGRPLIAHTILAARACTGLDRIILSTDDDEIAAVAREYGAEVPFMRPAELAGDTAHVMDVTRHALQYLETKEGYRPDLVLLLQPTSPLRATIDIENALAMLETTGANAVVSVCEAKGHPYLMKTLDDNGRLAPFMDTTMSSSRRQDLPPVYALNGAIYLVRRIVLLESGTWCPPGALGYVMPPDRSVDIDTAADLQYAGQLLAGLPAAPVMIGSHIVGPGAPCFIIAEAGVNHGGDLETALRLVDAAAAAGADAVKFQTFKAETLVCRDAPKADYQKRTTGTAESQFEMLARLELDENAHRRILARCHQRGIVFLSTPFDEDSADFLEALGVPAFKLGSGDLTNLPLLRHVALKGKPLILSTGMSDQGDVDAAVTAARTGGARDIILMQCVSNYPAAPADINLRAMQTMAAASHVLTGYSDHTPGIAVAAAATALGACVIEKHLTLDRTLPGPDHASSLEPADFTALVSAVRTVQSALGDGRKRPAPSEAAVAAVARRSLVANRDIPAGQTLTGNDIGVKRPGTGMRPALISTLVGRISKAAIRAGQPFTPDMFR